MLSCIPARRRVLRTHVPHLSLFWLKLVAPTWLHIAQLSPLHWQHLRAVMPSRKRSPKSKQMKTPKRARAYPSSFLRCGVPQDGMKTPDLVEKVASSGDESTVTTLYADAGPSGSKGDATDDSGQKTPTRNSRKQKKKNLGRRRRRRKRGSTRPERKRVIQAQAQVRISLRARIQRRRPMRLSKPWQLLEEGGRSALRVD